MAACQCLTRLTRLTSVGIRLSFTIEDICMQVSFCFVDKAVRGLLRDSQFASLSLTRRLFIFDILWLLKRFTFHLFFLSVKKKVKTRCRNKVILLFGYFWKCKHNWFEVHTTIMHDRTRTLQLLFIWKGILETIHFQTNSPTVPLQQKAHEPHLSPGLCLMIS